MTPQPTSCTACTPCQTSQQPAAHRQHLPTPHPASPAAHLPQQITPPTAKNHPPQPRRRRGQILYLTGIWPLQYSQYLGYSRLIYPPCPLPSPPRRPAAALGTAHRRPGTGPACRRPVRPRRRKGTAPRRRARCGFRSPKIFLGVNFFEGLPRFCPPEKGVRVKKL